MCFGLVCRCRLLGLVDGVAVGPEVVTVLALQHRVDVVGAAVTYFDAIHDGHRPAARFRAIVEPVARQLEPTVHDDRDGWSGGGHLWKGQALEVTSAVAAPTDSPDRAAAIPLHTANDALRVLSKCPTHGTVTAPVLGDPQLIPVDGDRVDHGGRGERRARRRNGR